MKVKLTDELKKQFPYLSQYVEKYGDDDLPSTFDKPVRFKSMEELYKYCIEQNLTWREVVKLPKGIAGKDYIL